MPITTAFFDLGSTLLYFKDPWPPIYDRADRALARVLEDAGISIDPSAFYAGADTFLDAYYTERGDGTIETTTFTALIDLLTRKGFRDVPDALVREALDALYTVTQQNWYLEEDAIPTLKALLESGYRLGAISNTSDDKNVQQLLDHWGLRPYFELIVTSAGCGIRKPDERIFQIALDHFGVMPEQAAMIGDTPEADILGANRLGMYAVWITRRREKTDPGAAHPDAVARTLQEVPALLAAIG
jgi:HAD superfamily hydrolase (TIGR01549 family)